LLSEDWLSDKDSAIFVPISLEGGSQQQIRRYEANRPYKPQRGGAKMAALTEIAMKIRERGVSGTVRAGVNRARAHFNGSYRFLRRTKGVIHVGANEGQERDIYARYNLNVLWIEPLLDVFRILGENISRSPRQTAENYLITDCDDKEYVLHVASNQGASFINL